MTNPKDEGKPKVKKKAKSEWKKVENVNKAVTTINPKKNSSRSSEPKPSKRRDSVPLHMQSDASAKPKILLRRNTCVMPDVLSKPEVSSSPVRKPVKQESVERRRSSAALLLKEPEKDQDDPQAAYRNTVFELIKNTFSLAFGEEGELRINVDNVYPILKTVGLNAKNESIMDLVRDASMESTGEIDPANFEKVVMSMVKSQDQDLWVKRLEEKEASRIEKEAERAKAEAEKLRIAEEREKVGFEQEEEEQKDEWTEYEKQKEDEEKEKKKEAEVDELYDNLKMAFRFIDSDGDGVISTLDIYNLMMGLGEMLTDDELFGMVNLADLDCDGKVTFEDFRRFLATAEELEAADNEKQTDETIPGDIQEDPAQSDVTAPEDSTENVANNAEAPDVNTKPDGKLETDTNKKEEPVVQAEGPSEAERLRRKKSMLWGYMSSASKLVTAMQKPAEEEKLEETKEETMTSEAKEEAGEGTESDAKTEPAVDQVDAPDASGLLHAIQEEDEHSNYDIEETDKVKSTVENRITNIAEHKRKIFSRQSSSASMKAQGLSASDSIGDSGIETMNESEVRDQSDVFDISDDEEIRPESKQSTLRNRRKSSLSTCDIYTTDNEDDEDMVEAHHVHESLSRVSSMESLDDFKDHLPKEDDNKEDRIRNFVNQHMYIEIRQDSDETEIVDETDLEIKSDVKHVVDEHKIARAQYLEKAILRRSATVPVLTVAKSRTNKPFIPKPSVNGLMCSHIDIDLTCESPPKADIKSKILFNERVKSARLNRSRPESARSTKTIAVVDISETVGNKTNMSQAAEKSRWPMRPLTRPRSPGFRRVQSATSGKSSSDVTDACELSIDVISDRTPRGRPATPLCRTRSTVSTSSDLPRQSLQRRPQTARSYSTTRTIETPITKFEKKDNISVVVTEPFKSSEELYPRKTLLTRYHHGFKSIWPIGRKANLIRHKRPFSAFEMNSYSRSIERNEFPLHIGENVSKLLQDSERSIPPLNISGLSRDSKVIRLELDASSVASPVSSRPSSFNPRRTAGIPRVLCSAR